LSICKGIIEAHGGKIGRKMAGIVFCFTLHLPLAMDVLYLIFKEEGDGERSTHPAD
jgi:hypothetical protein